MNGQSTLSLARQMTSSDICKVIDACHKAGVTKIKLGDMEVQFVGYVAPLNLTIVANSPNNELNDTPFQGVMNQEEELERLLLEDPSAYESLVPTE
jgi:hypothetical protein